jgi:outer membrane protein assembly factor BamB
VVRGPKLLWSRKFTTTVRPAATIADADGDGKSDVLFPENPDGQSHGLYAFRGSDGAEIWHTRWSWQDDIILRPMALADADGDGKREAVSYVGLDVMAFKIPGGAQVADVPCGVRGYATPAVGDLDGDAKPDAAIAAWFEPMGIHAFSIADKRRLWHFPGFRIACFAGPTIADVDGDGKPEVLGASLGGTFACLDGRTGEPRWVRELGVRLGAEAVVADVTGDGRPDILLSCGDGTLRVFDGQGNEVQRAEKVTGPACVPALADADGDGVLDVVCGVQIGFCCVSFREGPRILWKFAARGKGGSSAAVGDLDGKGTRVAVFSPWDGFVYCVDLADGKERWRQRTGDPTVESSPQLGDLDGDGILDVVFGSYDCSLYAVSGRGMRR